jgi:hypothetical protein
MVKIDDPQWHEWGTKKSDQSTDVRQIIDGNQIQDGCHSSRVGWVAVLVIERNIPPVTPNEPPKDGGHLGWAAELVVKRNLPLVTPTMSHIKIRSIDPGVWPVIDGNQNPKLFWCSGHFRMRALMRNREFFLCGLTYIFHAQEHPVLKKGYSLYPPIPSKDDPLKNFIQLQNIWVLLVSNSRYIGNILGWIHVSAL